MGKKLCIASLVVFLSFSTLASEDLEQTVWHEKMMIRDRISRDDGRVLEVIGFSLSRGDFSIEVDQVHRRVISVTGAMHDVNPEMFKVMQSRLEDKPLEGWSTQENDETVDGEKDRIVKINVKDLGITFSEDFIWTIRNSDSVDLKLSLHHQSRTKTTMTLEMNLGDSTNPNLSTMTLIDKIQI